MTEADWNRRDFFRRTAIFGAAALAAPAALAACSKVPTSGTDVLSQAKQAGSIKIGIAGEKPYGYTDSSGKVTGEAPEVARAIFKNLGVADVKAVQVDFKQLIPALNAHQFDMVCAGMDILPSRCQNAQFSDPDYTAQVSFLVPKGNPKNVMSFTDVVSQKVVIAVESGAVETDFATKSGVPAGQMLSFSDPSEMLSAVTSGRAYAAALTDISLKNLVQQNPSANVEVTPGFEPVINGQKQGETGGFVFRKDAGSLVSQFNDQLKQLHTSGEWLRIVQPFGFSAGNIPAPDVTTAKLCSASS